MAIIGGAGWTAATASAWDKFACDWGIPSCADFRRQDAIPNGNSSYVGNLGYGANPALVKRLQKADLLIVAGPRRGEATTDGYTVSKAGREAWRERGCQGWIWGVGGPLNKKIMKQ